MSEPLFHIARAALWAQAAEVGQYTQSTRDQTLEEVGFIHCSYQHQVLGVSQRYYSDETEPLLLLKIDPAKLVAEVVSEGKDPYPHIYGPLNISAVVKSWAFERGQNGTFHLPLGCS